MLNELKAKFDALNVLCFEGQLERLPIELSNARTYLGLLRYKRKRKLLGGWRYSDFKMVFSSRLRLLDNEREVEDIILHEMIHYYILSNQMQDTGPHGVLFKKMMRGINSRFDRHIAASHKVTDSERERDKEVRQHLICVTCFRDGRYGITVSARTRLFQLWKEMQDFPDAEECRWYVSTNPYFNRFPRAKTPKAYLISEEELEKQLSDAKRLVKVGDTIAVGNAMK